MAARQRSTWRAEAEPSHSKSWMVTSVRLLSAFDLLWMSLLMVPVRLPTCENNCQIKKPIISIFLVFFNWCSLFVVFLTTPKAIQFKFSFMHPTKRGQLCFYILLIRNVGSAQGTKTDRNLCRTCIFAPGLQVMRRVCDARVATCT